MRKAYLASIVPVIVNAVLNEHQVIVDIIAFVSKGDFPRSRLGEKQRGKILASWVTRKMRTIAQFGIRDTDTADSQTTEVAEPRSVVGSVVGKKSSLRNVESIAGGAPLAHDYNALPAGTSDMPAAQYESSIVESPPIPTDEDQNDTPTDTHGTNFPFSDERHFPLQQPDESSPENHLSSYPPHHPQQHDNESSPINTASSSEFDFTPAIAPPQPRYESKPTLSSTGRDLRPSQIRLQQDAPPVPPLPATSGASRSNYDFARAGSSGGSGGARGAGKLRITNADSDDEGDWPREAIMHMNMGGERRGSGRGGGSGAGGIAGGGGGRGGGAGGGQVAWDTYDGRGYGNAI